MENYYPKSFSGGSLNTLAQNGTAICDERTGMPATVIVGQGSPLGDNKVMKGRAKRKSITQKCVLSLQDVAADRDNPELVKSLWNTYHCQNRLVSHDGRYYGRYCKNRFCTLCCSNRKADIINRYLPLVKEWESPYFVTLTIRACHHTQLKKMMAAMIRGFKRILGRCKKRAQREKGVKLIGVRSLECNFNPTKKTYNPHFHLLVANCEIAETILNEWLQLWTPKHTLRVGQHLRQVNELERDMIETIKYGSKIFTEPDIKKKTKEAKDWRIYSKAHCNIIEAMKGLRIFERFGFHTLKVDKSIKEARVITNFSEWFFVPEYHDWLSAETEQTLSGYCPLPETLFLLENCIDKQLE